MMKKVLIVDDDKIFVSLLTNKLPEKGYAVVSAGNGEEGLKKAVEEKPDLILLDMVMPIMDGLAFLAELRKIEEFVNTPVYILSQASDFNKIANGMELGVKGYIIKSDLTLDQIVDLISSTLAE